MSTRFSLLYAFLFRTDVTEKYWVSINSRSGMSRDARVILSGHLTNLHSTIGTIWTSAATSTLTLSPSNIGKGNACRLWVVEAADHNTLTPVGCVGELLIEGPNVARGYINEPEKTKAAFIEGPIWLKDSSHRLYKTGDLVRYDSDGTLVICGRKDNQVKYNGCVNLLRVQ